MCRNLCATVCVSLRLECIGDSVCVGDYGCGTLYAFECI